MGRTVNSIFWSTSERFLSQGSSFLFSIVIARHLLPGDYGVVAMLTIFLAVAQALIDAGFSNALIQKQDRTQADLSTVFYFNIVVGVLCYLVFRVCSPCIAVFFEQPLLSELIPWVGLNLIVTSFSTVQTAILSIKLNFRLQTYISLVSVIISGVVGVYMATHGYGVWTLIWQTLVLNTVRTLLLWLTAQWFPSFIFSWQSFVEMFSFGSKMMMSALLAVVYNNLYSLFIGKYYTSKELGLFGRAQTWVGYPSTNVTQILSRVAFPIECELQRDEDALTDKFMYFIKSSSFFIFPVMLGMAAVSKPLIRIVLTDKWIDVVPIMQMLCLALMWDTVQRLTCDLLKVVRRSDLLLWSEFLKKLVGFSILIATVSFGVFSICIGMIIYAFADILIITQYTKRVLPKTTFWGILKPLAPTFASSMFVALIVLIVINQVTNSWAQLIIGLSLGSGLYISINWLFGDRALMRNLFCAIFKKK